MKPFFWLIFLILTAAPVFAQSQGVVHYHEKAGGGEAISGNTKNSSTSKSQKSNLDRQSMVDARQRGYEKQFKHRKFKRNTPMGECPGNPKNKLNRKNPYKQERKREDRIKPAKRKIKGK